MFANKSITVVLLVCALVITGCASEPAPLVLHEPTATPIQQQPTSEVFIGIPPIHDPLVQFENESVEEFVARITARDVSYGQPLFIAFSQLENKNDLSFWVSSDKDDIQLCWLYETDSILNCSKDDLDRYLSDESLYKIFFAFAHSNSTKALFLIEYSYEGDEYGIMDYYRLVLELRDGKWIEKSILPGFW